MHWPRTRTKPVLIAWLLRAAGALPARAHGVRGRRPPPVTSVASIVGNLSCAPAAAVPNVGNNLSRRPIMEATMLRLLNRLLHRTRVCGAAAFAAFAVAAPPVFAQQVPLDPVYNVSVTPDGAAATVYAGAAAYTFTVRNAGNTADGYDLSATCSGSVTGCSPAVAYIWEGKGISKTVVVNYTASAAGGAGTVTLHASSQTDVGASDDGWVNITVPKSYAVAVTPDGAKDTAYSYSPASRVFAIKNTGGRAATFYVRNSCSGRAVTGCSVAPTSVTLDTAQTATATVSYTPGFHNDTGSIAVFAKYSGDTTILDGGSAKVLAKSPCVGRFGELYPCRVSITNPASSATGMLHGFSIGYHHPYAEPGSYALTCLPSGAVTSCHFSGTATGDTLIQSIVVKSDSTARFTLRFTTIGTDTTGSIKVIAQDIDSLAAMVAITIKPAADPGGAGGANLVAFDLTPDYQSVAAEQSAVISRAALLTNRGTRVDTFTVTRSCSGLAIVAACTPASAQQILTAGASVQLPITLTTAAQAGTRGTATIIVSRQSEPGGADSSRYDVTVIALPARAVDVASVNPGTSVDRSLCLNIAAAGAASYECGALRVAHALPGTITLGKARVPTLLYNSRDADPRPLVAALVNIPNSATLPTTVSAKLTIGGAIVSTGSWPGSDWRLGQTRRIALDFDGSSYATGVYHYVLSVTRDQETAIISDTASGDLVIVNRRASPFGAGWWLAGLEQIVARGDTILWVGGDASAQRYLRDAAAPTVFRPAMLDQRDSITWDATRQTYVRNLPNRLHVEFNAVGQHVRTINRLGDTTTFRYEGATSRCLTSITVPPTLASRTYRLEYDDNCASATSKLTRVTAPGSGLPRRTAVSINAAQQVDSVVDPDGYAVRFAYATGYAARIGSRTDRRGTVTSYVFGAGNLLREVRTAIDTGAAGTVVVGFAPQETRGIAGQSAVALENANTVFDGPRSDVPDSTTFWLDRFGEPMRIRNALGDETSVSRDDVRFPALVTKIRAPNGAVSTALYDSLARVTQQIDSSTCDAAAGRCATTSYTWNGNWHLVASVTPPEGTSTTFSYDSLGNLQWTQPGTDATRRVLFGYDEVFKLPTSTLLPGSALRDSTGYDAFGNVRFVQSELGAAYRTVFYKDSIGQDTLVVSPIDVGTGGTAGSLYTTTRSGHDIMGRDTLVVATRPAILSGAGPSAAATHSQRSSYDPNGNLTRHVQWVSPDPNAIDSLITSWQYDRANRKIKETIPRALRFPGSKSDSSAYDPAGNVVAYRTRSGFPITMQYDALGRLVSRIVPSRGIGFPSGYTWGARIPADTTRYVFDGGNMIGASNTYSRIKRRYNLNSTLAADTLRIRTADTLQADFTQHVYGIAYGYDLSGRRLWTKYPASLRPAFGQDSVAYGYDPVFGGLSWAEDMFRNRQTFTYTVAGRLETRSMPGGVISRNSYNPDGSLGRRTDDNGTTLLHDDSLYYDARGKMTRASVLVAGGYEPFPMAYDGFGALTYAQSYNEMKRTEKSVVDALQNISSTQRFGNATMVKTSATSYEPGNGQLLKTVASVGETYSDTARYDYEGSGNRTYTTEMKFLAAEGQTAAVWLRTTGRQWYSADDKLMAYSTKLDSIRGSATFVSPYNEHEEYWYDAFGRRIRTRVQRGGSCPWWNRASGCRNEVTRTIWDGAQILAEVKTPGDAAEADLNNGSEHFGRVEYVHGGVIDKPLAVVRMEYNGTTVVIPHANYRGMFDSGTCVGADGVACDQIEWPAATASAYMELARSDSGEANWFGSLIAEKSDASGLLYMRNRYMDPKTGKFTQPDPIGLAGGLNVYGYANGDPVNYSDPFGLGPEELGVSIAMFVASLAATHPAVMRALERVGMVPEAYHAAAQAVEGFGKEEVLEYTSKQVAKEAMSGGTKSAVWTGAKRAASGPVGRVVAKNGLRISAVALAAAAEVVVFFIPTTIGDPEAGEQWRKSHPQPQPTPTIGPSH